MQSPAYLDRAEGREQDGSRWLLPGVHHDSHSAVLRLLPGRGDRAGRRWRWLEVRHGGNRTCSKPLPMALCPRAGLCSRQVPLWDTPAMGSTSPAETCALGSGTWSSGLAARGHSGDIGMCPKQHVQDTDHPSWLGPGAVQSLKLRNSQEVPAGPLALTWAGSRGGG